MRAFSSGSQAGCDPGMNAIDQPPNDRAKPVDLVSGHVEHLQALNPTKSTAFPG
jgi:hypothetical protein